MHELAHVAWRVPAPAPVPVPAFVLCNRNAASPYLSLETETWEGFTDPLPMIQ